MTQPVMVRSCASRRMRVLQFVGRRILPSQPSRTRKLVAPRADLQDEFEPWNDDKASGSPSVISRAALKSRTSQTQQRHLEYLATSLQSLDNNDWGSHSSSNSSDEMEELGLRLAQKQTPKLRLRSKRRIRKNLGMAQERCLRRPTTRDANCERTKRWTPPSWNS